MRLPILGVADFGPAVQFGERCLGAIVDAEETFRLFSCGWCGRQVRLCRGCDRGQRYCGVNCAAEQRRNAQRLASRAYQKTRRGAHLHAARMQRYRDRRADRSKFPAPIVTQHPWAQASRQAIWSASSRTELVRSKEVSPSVPGQSVSAPRCTLCGTSLPCWTRLDLRATHYRPPRRRRNPRLPTGPPRQW